MDDAMSIVNKWVDDLVKHVQEVANESYKEAGQELLPEIEVGLEMIYQQAVDQWYGAYSPEFYGRSGSVYDLMEIEAMPEDLYLEYAFNGDGLTHDRHGGSLFQKVFVKGWHGGAYDGSTMRYRKPVGFWYMWGRQAVRTASPYFLFEKRKKTMEDKYSQRLQQMVLEKIKAKL